MLRVCCAEGKGKGKGKGRGREGREHRAQGTGHRAQGRAGQTRARPFGVWLFTCFTLIKLRKYCLMRFHSRESYTDRPLAPKRADL